jgi:hypothetical protein
MEVSAGNNLVTMFLYYVMYGDHASHHSRFLHKLCLSFVSPFKDDN